MQMLGKSFADGLVEHEVGQSVISLSNVNNSKW